MKACSSQLIRASTEISINECSAEGRLGIKPHVTHRGFVKSYFGRRENNSHKGTYGRALIIATSKGMAGAGLLSSEAAIRTGVGIVMLAVPDSLMSIVSGKVPEIMTKGLTDNNQGCLSVKSYEEIMEESKKSTAILIGPGLGSGKDILQLVAQIIINYKKPLVIDADGLNALSKDLSFLEKKSGEVVITPHPGEMARLLKVSSDDIQNDRIGYAREFAKKYKVTVVLKGHHTVISTSRGETWINPTGNPGMATAGAGDVLAGIITALIAQGFTPQNAAICGVYVHGSAGDKAADEYGQWGMTARDIIRFIPNIIKNMEC